MESPLKFIPVAGTNNRVVIKRDKAKSHIKQFGHGIVGVTSGTDQKNTGIVLGVSEIDDKWQKPYLKVGYRVIFEEYSVKKFSTLEEEELLTCRESSIIGVFTQDEVDSSIQIDEQILEDIRNSEEALTHPDR